MTMAATATTARMATQDRGANMARDDEFITIARVVKTQGRRGEVAVALHTDFPEKFAARKRLSAWLEDGSRRELALENHWPHKDGMVLKFAGIEDISAAEELIGSEVQIPRSERAEPASGAYFVSDLTGCTVCDQGREVGEITGVDFGSGEAPNLRVRCKAREVLVPFAAAYIERVDLEARRVDMKLPAGLLEIDGPLTADEKQRQG